MSPLFLLEIKNELRLIHLIRTRLKLYSVSRYLLWTRHGVYFRSIPRRRNVISGSIQ